jgi:hypothetical protein
LFAAALVVRRRYLIVVNLKKKSGALCRGLCLRRRPLALGQAPCARRLEGGYGFICRPRPPNSRCTRLFLQTARYREKRSARQLGAAAPAPPLSAALGLSVGGLLPRATKRLVSGGCPRFPLRWACLAGGLLRDRGQRGAWQVELPPPHPAFRCARLVLQAIRYHGQRALGRWGLPPHHLRFSLRSACLAESSLPRATKRLTSCARTCVLVSRP